MATHWMVVTETWKSRPSVASATATIVVSRIDMIDPRTTTLDVRRSSGERVKEAGELGWRPWRLLHNTQRYGVVKDFPRWDNRSMGVAEDAFERLRRVAFEGEHVERMAALGARLQLSPGVIKTLMRLGKQDGVSMGDMARGIGVDPSYITALVDDLDARGLARREPAPYDRRVKIIVLTDAGRAVAADIDQVLSVPPAAFSGLSQAELRQLRDLLDKVVEAQEADRAARADDVAAAS